MQMLSAALLYLFLSANPPAANHTLPILDSNGSVTASAALIDPEFVLTAWHTVDDAPKGVVLVGCGKRVLLGVVRKHDAANDLALVQLVDACTAVEPLRVATQDLPLGADFHTQGYPGGFGQKTTHASVASYEMHRDSPKEEMHYVLVYDGSVAFGNSGGPGFVGNVLVGIVSAIYSVRAGDAMWVKYGLLIPASVIFKFLATEE